MSSLAQANAEPTDTPSTPASTNAPASSTSAPAAATDATAAATNAASTAADTAKSREADAKAKTEAEDRARLIDKRLRAQGYKPVVRNGQTVYCRGEQELGSRFTKQVCATADDMERVTTSDKEAMSNVQRNQLGGRME